MKRDFNSNNLERPQNISSNFVTEGFQLVTSARWILSRVDSRSAEPRRLLHFCCSSQTSLFLPLISGSQACFFFRADFATVQMLLRESAAALRQFLCEETFQSSQR